MATASLITEIGIAAGDIWHQLDQKGSCTLEQLSASIKKPKDLLLMSLGWLAREGHVIVEGPETGHRSSLAPRR